MSNSNHQTPPPPLKKICETPLLCLMSKFFCLNLCNIVTLINLFPSSYAVNNHQSFGLYSIFKRHSNNPNRRTRNMGSNHRLASVFENLNLKSLASFESTETLTCYVIT